MVNGIDKNLNVPKINVQPQEAASEKPQAVQEEKAVQSNEVTPLVVDANNSGAIQKVKIALNVITPNSELSSDVHSAFREIEGLTLNNKYEEAVPKVLNWLLMQKEVSQSDCIKAAGICLLANKYNIYENLVKSLPGFGQRKTLSETEKEYIKTEIKKQEELLLNQGPKIKTLKRELGPNGSIFETLAG